MSEAVRLHRALGLIALVLAAACTRSPAPSAPGSTAAEPPGTVLLLSGSAFETQAARDEAVRTASEVGGRPARMIAEEPPMERAVQSAATRLGRTAARAARAETRDGACRKKGRAIATAVAERADVILRVRLDAKTTSRPATDADRKAQTALAGMLAAVGLGDDTVYETVLDGTIERTTFPGSPTLARRRIHTTTRRLAAKDAPPSPSVHDALAEALAAMPPPAAARWDPIARGLVTGGCPVLGSAVADVLVDDAAAKRRLHSAALSVLGPTPKREEPAAGPVDTTSAPVETVTTADAEPAPEPTPDPGPATTEPAYACTTLCSLHMVELCNNDRTLWTQHGSRWENTRCGLRRNEGFLEDCYRMQWLSGTYEQACVRPCEDTADGRTRLVAMLRRSGCLRSGG